jgi:hypothetical protein
VREGRGWELPGRRWPWRGGLRWCFFGEEKHKEERSLAAGRGARNIGLQGGKYIWKGTSGARPSHPSGGVRGGS